MPTDAPPAKGKGKGLNRKLGPLPLWAWAVILAAAGWYLWKHLSTATATATTQANPQPTGTDTGLGNVPTAGTSGDTSGAGVSGFDTSALTSTLGQNQADTQAMLDQLAQQEYSFEQQVADQLSNLGSNPQVAPTPPDLGRLFGATMVSQPGGSNAPVINYHPIPATVGNFAKAAQIQTSTLKAQGTSLPFGGVVKVQKLANGATLTTYASGHQVEQAPGKSAYVTKK